MDRITLRGVRAYGRHGYAAAERERRQVFAIDLSAEIDLRGAASSDDLSQTMDYASLHARLVHVVASTSYALLERLAADLLDAVFDDRRVVSAELTLSKPGILDGATPSVTLERFNPRYEAP
ncbi:MAG: dihydroneopterin aldolase [Candidatus Eremiobacteraeota bacterium]|nr:dihydroneopterin aldolase [Candidatus Eremiobacteraeota bacterium]